MWSNEGIKYFKRAGTKWVAVYKDEKFMRILYSGWESWLEKKRKEKVCTQLWQCGQRTMKLVRKREWRGGTTMPPKLVQAKVRMRSRRDIVQIWTSGRCPIGDGQKMRGGRAITDTALQMTKGVGKVKRKSVAMRETEPEREGNLGRRGMKVLAVWRLVRQKTQGQVHEG